MRRTIAGVVVISLSLITLFQATSAIFEETVKIAGTSFTVGTTSGEYPVDENTALKFLIDLSGDASDSNLTDIVPGPVFDNITVDWTDQVVVKVHNKGDTTLDLISKADYISDPDVLRDDIFVEVLEWNDIDNDGELDPGEEGVSYGYDSILRWRNDTFLLGTLAPSETRGFAIKFDGTGVTDANFGMEAIYDFLITGAEQQ